MVAFVAWFKHCAISIGLLYSPFPALDIFQKVNFCTAFYSKEVNLYTLVMTKCFTIYRIFLYPKSLFISFFVYLKSTLSIFPIVKMTAKYTKNDGVDSLMQVFNKCQKYISNIVFPKNQFTMAVA